MDSDFSPIIGIDLGTTNSVVAAYYEGKVQVITEAGESILPSVVAITADDKLIVGETAKNQLAAYPERTAASVKRRMGQAIHVKMADQEYSPQEISAMILRRLRQRAEQALGAEVTRAVITVPAFFDENQRQATREAGELAGLKVERIINEPTAASLVYHAGNPERRHLIVYDLGGGTFDVSIVRIEQGVVEVLSSKGDTQLGGDDFDELLTEYVAKAFVNEHNVDLMEQSNARWRLIGACERAKCELSTSSVARIAEEFITSIDGNPVNLDMEVSRRQYEQLIEPLVQRTIECVDEAIRDAGLTTKQLDELILVGGSTRTPLVQHRLQQEFGRHPRWSVNPDLAVALGAASQAATQAGTSVGPVLIDCCYPYIGYRSGGRIAVPTPIEVRSDLAPNSPLPARYEETFYKNSAEQQAAEISVFQGESEQLSQNRSLGRFMLDGLNDAGEDRMEILVRFELTLDGTLEVTATEHATGNSKSLQLDNALSSMGQNGGQASQDRLASMFWESEDIHEFRDQFEQPTGGSGFDSTDAPLESLASNIRIDAPSQPQSKRHQLLDQASAIGDRLSEEDRADLQRLIEQIKQAEQDGSQDILPALQDELEDLLFYLAE